ncbi:hypothetical protein [uncultured Cohaesibacter sp.]|uniref:hypothetical protein n=1 Tax=uncultured Cohaesibacter sp. TaxID=1002546 RepID=UPI00292F07A2|nr:hypothetical protein [uncultured Cohaesibacter sp.]
MTTAKNLSTTHASKWKDTVSCGDIVAFEMPSEHLYNPLQPPQKALPWLIVDEAIYIGTRYLTLARGHAIGTTFNHGAQIRVERSAAFGAAGLSQPTVYNLRGLVIVSVNHEGFAPNKDGTPVLGRLIGDELVQLEHHRALIHAINVERAEGRADLLKLQALLAKTSGRKMSGMIIPAPIAIPTPDPQK